ncbi:MAG: FliH/SctL family protein [Dermatophilus congolensis]|nr:FliH/SctL family protein [Dermatophilus congolensis]
MLNHNTRPLAGAQARPAAPAGYVLRGDEATERTRQAVLGSNLVMSPFAGVAYADPRLTDPRMHELVEEAREEARRLGYADGQAEGYEDGRVAGLELMDNEIRALKARTEQERAEIRAAFEELHANSIRAVADALVYQLPLIEELRDLVATLAVDIAEELAGHHLRVDGCAAVDSVRKALEQVPKHIAVRLRLNPADAAQVSEFVAEQEESSLFTVTADPTVQRGDAIAEAENLEVEVCLADALEAVRKVLHP